MLYFAYGSNMNFKQMEKRCPSSRFIKRACLEKYKFVYDGYSNIREGAVANIVKSKGSIVWGGLFKINKDNLGALDCCEGYFSKIYNRKTIIVNDDEGKSYKAIVYLRTGKDVGMPHQKYRNIIIKGAKDCGLPKGYRKIIKAF